MNQTDDSYLTIESPSTGLYKDKGSKFIGLAFPVFGEDEIKTLLLEVKNKYFDAHHHCYAWALGIDHEQFRVNDDGEPSGTAGRPIYGRIKAAGLTNILIVVIRYFGGTKLGVRGLINAYKEASQDAINQAVVMSRTRRNVYRISFPYGSMNEVMKILKDFDLPQSEHRFDLSCQLIFSVRQSLSEQVTISLKKLQEVEVQYLSTED
jgi:uncharacterized YigZ family protein